MADVRTDAQPQEPAPEAAAVGSPGAVSPALRVRLVRLAYRLLWNTADAEDAVQDALAVAQRRGGELRDERRWLSWVTRILVNRCHEVHRKRRSGTAHERDAGSQRDHVASGRQALDRLARDDAMAAMRRALLQLPPRQRDVVVLRHLEQMSYEQIGEILEISPATARVHAMAGLESLRGMLWAGDSAAAPP